MVTDLYQIGNHKIPLRQRSFKELTSELKSLLDSTKLINDDFLHQFALNWNADNPASLEEIEIKKDWTFLQEDEFYSFDEEKYLEVNGPHDLRISFDEFKLTFWNPPYRYKQWIELKNEDGSEATEHRNQWRQYMLQIVTLFGGDRVIYLADNSHPLEKYMDCECPIEEIKNKLLADFGKPCDTLKQVAQDYQNRYYIDRFTDLK